MPPTTTETTSRSTVPTTGSRHEWVHSAERNMRAHMIEATARMALVGSTAVASVYCTPVMRSEVLSERE